jgi:hypothetical protein
MYVHLCNEECQLLWCDAVKSSGSLPTFRRKLLPPSKRSKKKPSKRIAEYSGLFFCPVDGDKLFRNVRVIVPRLYGVTSQKTVLFIATAVKTWTPTKLCTFVTLMYSSDGVSLLWLGARQTWSAPAALPSGTAKRSLCSLLLETVLHTLKAESRCNYL